MPVAKLTKLKFKVKDLKQKYHFEPVKVLKSRIYRCFDNNLAISAFQMGAGSILSPKWVIVGIDTQKWIFGRAATS